MKPFVPKVVAIQDLSCFGRCSLTTIIPVLSCMGVQVCPLPTALFSTHLGGFGQPAFYDFTNHMPIFSQHWKREDVIFDCIYSGFLASEEQIALVCHLIDEFSQNTPLVVVDPVMGDGGKLYSTYTPYMQEQMKVLVKKADIITPNYTEACFLLGEPYQTEHYDMEKMKEWLVRLADLGPSIVVMTGIIVDQKKVINLGYDQQTGSFWEVSKDYIMAQYPGTGDIFASVLTGSLMKGKDLYTAMELASDFVALAIKATFDACTPKREGVLLESVLPWLCRKVDNEG
ncbi:pyridoxamine kinase [Pelosinus sp. sgz500959]|uniref:pyridoxamine kinase n=1 Tax=Pelosinus sp. sgz500959 TaxID=3242472 RepID=UPI0036731BBB